MTSAACESRRAKKVIAAARPVIGAKRKCGLSAWTEARGTKARGTEAHGTEVRCTEARCT